MVLSSLLDVPSYQTDSLICTWLLFALAFTIGIVVLPSFPCGYYICSKSIKKRVSTLFRSTLFAYTFVVYPLIKVYATLFYLHFYIYTFLATTMHHLFNQHSYHFYYRHRGIASFPECASSLSEPCDSYALPHSINIATIS